MCGRWVYEVCGLEGVRVMWGGAAKVTPAGEDVEGDSLRRSSLIAVVAGTSS